MDTLPRQSLGTSPALTSATQGSSGNVTIRENDGEGGEGSDGNDNGQRLQQGKKHWQEKHQ